MRGPRLGLVGAGDAGRHHARALGALHDEGVLQFRALAGRDRARAAAALAELGAPAGAVAHGGLDELLASGGCDAVILATPDGLHAEQVRACAAAGVHVLCEKPLALSSASAAAATAAARAAGVVLAVGYHLRHHAGHVLLRARLDELVGVPRAIDVRWAWPDPAVDGWRARGDGARWWSLAALGTHAVDLALWLTGAAPHDARILTTPPAGVDLAAEIVLRLRRPGAGATDLLAHVACAVTHRETPRLLIAGDAGEVEALGTLGARGEGTITVRGGRAAPELLSFTPADPYLAQLRAFVARIAAGDTAPDPLPVTNLEILERGREPGTAPPASNT
jgi:1,5-anhydro-D-fructose reductase (1,5-anhydro-D-mannitol-forming)